VSADRRQTAAKVKIKAYPFAAGLDQNGVKKNVEILYLTQVGFLARLPAATMVSVGEYYQAGFEIPAGAGFVNTQVRVIKTYDRSIDPKQHVIERVAELRFERLTDAHKKAILAFVAAIGQK
jgi:hypothetical protein